MDDSNIELSSTSMNANKTLAQHNLDVREATDGDLATELSDADPTDADILCDLDHSKCTADDIDLDDAGNDVSNVTVQSAKAHDVNKEENEEMSFMDLSLADFNDTTEDILQVCSYSVMDQ